MEIHTVRKGKTMKKSVAIITARGGSKRIPRKNIREFCGKPIIAYSIEAALKSGVFDTVMVSTDDTEIVEIAKNYGAEVPFLRSEKTASDFATTADVIKEVLAEYEKRGEIFEYAACVYPTAPFITPERLTEAMQLMKEKEPVEVLTVVPFSFPPLRSFVIRENGFAEYKYPEYKNARSQDLEKQYHDAGQFYIYHVPQYLERGGNIKDGLMPLILSELEVQDIDNEDDWKVAEFKYKLLGSED